jgi:hypothetical protein
MRNSLSGPRGKPPSKPNDRLLAMPVMLLAKLGSEKADRPVSHRWIEDDLTYRVENTL